MNIPENKYKEIEELISSDKSVVGIDAKRTHIIIIHMLREIQDRLELLEQRLDSVERKIK